METDRKGGTLLRRGVGLCLSLSIIGGLCPWAYATSKKEQLPAQMPEDQIQVLHTVSYSVEGGSLSFDTSTGEIIGCSNAVASVVIPSEINGVAVTAIGDFAFSYCAQLTDVSIPDSVTSIGVEAFSHCIRLTGVTIPDSVTCIGDSAFSVCSSMTRVSIGASVTSIGEETFAYCPKLTGVTIPESVTSIGNSAFSGCDSLTDVTIPAAVTSVGAGAFSSCGGLNAINVDENNKVYCSVGGILFNKTATTLCAYPGGKTRTYTIPNGVTSIGDSAFFDCDNLTGVSIPESVTSIGNSAFSNCDNLNGITIPESVTSIGNSAFSNCDVLTSMAIPASVTSIGDYTFSNCDSLTSVTIPESVTSIGSHAFYSCDSLTSVTIPTSVINIGDQAFSACSGLTSVTILGGVISIGEKAFYSCGSLRSMTIPDSVTTIGDEAFSGCSSLTDVIIGDNVTAIGYRTFIDCSSLTNVIIGDSVTTIGQEAFENCVDLAGVTIPESVTSIGDSAFLFCRSMTSVIIGNSVTTIGEHAFNLCYALTSVTIPASVTTIGEYAFGSCDSLNSVIIPASVTSIGHGAFYECDSLVEIEVSPDNPSYGSSNGILFDKDMSRLIQYPSGKSGNCVIPDGVTAIEDSAFSYCPKLTGVTIPDSMISISDHAFLSCTGLASVTVPDNVTSIGIWAFGSCKNLTDVTIPASVISIGDDAFYGCVSLEDVYYTGSEKQWLGISIGLRNSNLTNAVIHYNYNHLIPERVGVHESDIDELASNILSDLDLLLTDVPLCDTEIKGPTFDVLGYEFCPIKFDAKAVLNLSGLSKNITIDEDNKTVHVILGKKNADGQANIVQTTDTCSASWGKQYAELKDLYKTMTGLKASGSDHNGVSNWNKFQKLKGQLDRIGCDLFIKGELSAVAYLDFDYQSGYLRLSEGGIIESASLGADLDYPAIANFVYITLGLKGAEDGTFRVSSSTTGTLSWYASLKPSITAKASVTGQIPGIASVTGGIDATLAVLLQTDDPKLTVTLGGNIFLDATLLTFEVYSGKWPYANFQLYPEFEQLSTMCLGDAYQALYTGARQLQRDYLYEVSPLSLENENAIYAQNSVYPNNGAQLVPLLGNAMMLVWNGDDGTKSDINRTSLFYSVYENGVWSKAQEISGDGTATGNFQVVSNGETVYIVYEKAIVSLNDDASVEDMLAAMNLYVIQYRDGVFDDPVCLSGDRNTVYESLSDAEISDDTLTVAWIENSNNDVFLSTGTTAIKSTSATAGVVTDQVTIAEVSSNSGDYLGDVRIVEDEIYYTRYQMDGDETRAELYLYSSGTSSLVSAGESIYNIENMEDTLYYLKDSVVYQNKNGVETPLEFNHITDFKLVSNGTNHAMLMAVNDGARNEIYISNLTDGVWSQAERFTDLGEYVRSYSPFMRGDGSVCLAVSVAEVNDDNPEATSMYGSTSLLVLEQCEYCDIITSYLYYDDEVVPEQDLALYFDVYNDCADKLKSVNIQLTDQDGTLLMEQDIPCEIGPYSSEELNISYHLPSEIRKTELHLNISIDRTETDTTNNTAATAFGYADLEVSPAECTVNSDGTVRITADIINNGFEEIGDVVVKIRNGSLRGDILQEIPIGTVPAGGVNEVEYTFPTDLMVSPDEDAMNAVYIVAESPEVESQYSDNSQKAVFDTPDYSTYSVTYANGVAMVAAPQPGTYAVIFASYRNGCLVSVEADAVTFVSAGIQSVTPHHFSIYDADEIKIMFLSSLKEMVPLCRSYQSTDM